MDSGILAASAGVAGKFAFSDFRMPGTIQELIVKVGQIALMLTLNSLMLSRYVKALERSDSALRVQVVNFATNFLVSVVFSVVIFGEGAEQLVSRKWWMGAFCMVGGVLVILGGRPTENTTKKE